MSEILVLTRGLGPLEAQAVTRLEKQGHRVHAYDVNGQWLKHGVPVPLWMRGYRLKRSGMATGYFAAYIASRGVDRVVAYGLAAAAFAADNIAAPFLAVLRRGDLDFSATRAEQVLDFAAVTAATDRVLLEDDWEMDKASAKGSRVLHLRAPHLLEHPEPALDPSAARVGVVHAEGTDPARLELHLANLRAVLGDDVEIATVSAESLYRGRDLHRRRAFAPTVRMRLAQFSQLVFLGTSPNFGAVLSALRADLGRVVLEDTVSTSALARDLGVHAVGRGVRVAELARDVVAGRTGEIAAGSHPRTVAPDADLLAVLDDLRTLDRPRGFEELTALQGTGPVDVFFSVAPLQDRTDGARPQRIRNMAQAMDRPQPAVRVFANRTGFDRRAAAVRGLLDAGRPAGILYGENSTSPLPDAALTADLGELVREFRGRGGRAAWFVRDLHWLDDVDGYLDDEADRTRIVAQGLEELDTMARSADVLLAPCTASGEGFDALLAAHGRPPQQWEPLPPGVAAANVSDPAALRPERAGTTLLYAGGLNSVYSMDRYLQAVRDLDEQVLLDFVVRPEEAARLEADLERHGIAVDERVRMVTAELDHYRPRTDRCLGMILLDSEYARFSFPYKTVSMIEHGFPILCFEDMAIAPFVREHGVGVACGHSSEDIRAGVERLLRDGAPGMAEARTEQSWDARVAGLRALLATG